MRRPVLVLLLALATALGGCKRRDDGADPSGAGTLPPLVLKDDTTEVLLTWIDARGDTHTAVRIAEVPVEGRNPVRVVVKDAGHGLLFYVADLTLKKGDSSYDVRTMSRAEWEALLETRRGALAHNRGTPEPNSKPPAPPSDDANENESETGGPGPSRKPAGKSATYAIVYGAAWCGPCHQARDYLVRRGVAVTFYDIEKEPKREVEMRKKLRDAGRRGGNIPVIDVGGQLFVGYNPRSLDKALADAKPAAGTPI